MTVTKTETSQFENEGPRVVYLALDVAERGKSTALAVLQDARIELRTALDGGLELAEKLSAGALRFARKLVQQIDDASADALKGSDQALAEALQRARQTARAGKQLADKAVERVTAGRQTSAA